MAAAHRLALRVACVSNAAARCQLHLALALSDELEEQEEGLGALLQTMRVG